MPNPTLSRWFQMVWEALDEEDQLLRERKLEEANAVLKCSQTSSKVTRLASAS